MPLPDPCLPALLPTPPQIILTHDPECLSLPDNSGNTPLHVAVRMNNAELLNYLLSLKPNLDYQNINSSEYASGNWLLHGEEILPLDKTALHMAVEDDLTEIVEALLEAGRLAGLLCCLCQVGAVGLPCMRPWLLFVIITCTHACAFCCLTSCRC